MLQVDGAPTRNQSIRNKRSLAVDLKSPHGVDIVKALSRKADVLIEPYRPGKIITPMPHDSAYSITFAS